MRLILRIFAVVLLAATALRGGPLKENYRFSERGQMQEFTVSHDEVHRGGALERFHAALRSVAEVRAAAGKGDLILYPKTGPRDASTRRYVTRQVAVRLAAGFDIGPVATFSHTTLVRSMGKTQRWYVLDTGPAPGSALEAAEDIRRFPGVLAVEPQLARQQVRRSTIPTDPLFGRQWHLRNTGQSGGLAGIDIDVVDVWDRFRGNGVTIGIVDDGLEHSHPDLSQNYSAALSYDFNFHDADPEPPRFDFDDHGTACAGVAAARGFNSRGVVGAAFEATIAGLRLISLPTSDAQEADAFVFRNDAIFIKSNSWGPTDNAKILAGAGPLARAALEDAVADGRNGHGTIFVWACGNGGEVGDNANYDGYANQPQALAVGALTNTGQLASYSEQGANVVIVAPSSGGTLDITTVDRKGDDGYNFNGNTFDPVGDRDYTGEFGGTSSSAPLVAGAMALILQANPQLGWRDVREILIRTARKVVPSDPDWVNNGAGFHFNHKFGAGLIDVKAAVALAETWQNLGPRISASREVKLGAQIIPDNNPAGVVNTFTFSESELRVEHASVTVDIRHSRRGQVRIELESPAGTKSVLAPGRTRDIGKNFMSWTFTSVHHWGENAAGTWKVRVIDTAAKTVGTIVSLKVDLAGSSFPLPIIPDGAILVTEENTDKSYNPGELVTVNFGLKNMTANPIDNVVATLGEEGGVLSPSGPQNYGSLAPGQTVSRPFTFTVGVWIGENMRPALALTGSVDKLGRALFKLPVGRHPPQPLRFVSNSVITIPGTGTSGPASQYPSFFTLYPFGLPRGTVPIVTKVTATLHGFTHGRSEDVDVVLVAASSGQSVTLMSDAGMGPVHNIDLTFDDDAAQAVSSGPLTSGTYRPKNLGARIDPMPGGPRPPFGTTLSVFDGLVPLDQWLLYIRDDQANGVGVLAGWELTIDYAY
jgi:subtilisin family serine protease/subtilisin-like proprotein convertase family protein